MSVNIPKINYPVGSPTVWMGTMYYNYRYDQLNRITGMNAHTGFLNNGVWPAYMIALNDYRERVNYDANGNILNYLRNGTTQGGKPLGMDSLTYHYYSGTNQLRRVTDIVRSTNYTEDIDNQDSTNNYVYDAIGNLIQDKAEGIDSIKWNVYGKITNIYKASGLKISYTYDAGGNRISKKVINGTDTTLTWYARAATGNVMSVYVAKNDTLAQDEIHLYGSSRIGILKPGRILTLDEQYGETIDTLDLSLGLAKGSIFRRGQKFFELANHLGNVLVTISDKKLGLDTNGDSTVNYYMPDVMTAGDYYPFGMGMVGRKFTARNKYRYGFNGKENDDDVKGDGMQQDYGFRIYDPRTARFLSSDPLSRSYPELTPYQFASNRPIDGIDLDGLEYLQHNSNHKYSQSVYRLNKYENLASNYTLKGHIWVVNKMVHGIVMDHPNNKIQNQPSPSEDDSVPETATFDGKRKDSRYHKAYNKAQARNANRKGRGDMASGILDFAVWLKKTSYEVSHSKEIAYAAVSLGALDQADRLMRAASNSGLPGALQDDQIRVALVNYMTDGYLAPDESLSFRLAVSTWGNLLLNNAQAVLEGKYNFSLEIITLKKISTGDGNTGHNHTVEEKVGNPSEELRKAHEVLKKPIEKKPEVQVTSG